MNLDPRSWFRRRTPIEDPRRAMAFELEQQQQRVRKLESRLQVRDSFGGGGNPYPWFGQLISPIAAYYDGIVPITAPAPMIWDTTLGLGVYFTEPLLDIIRAYARWFVASTPQAHGVLDRLTDLVIGTGFGFEVQEKRNERVGKETIKRAQRILDNFFCRNGWFGTQVDAYERLRKEGEWAPRLYPQDDAVTELRTMEPWQVRGLDTSPQHLFGVVSKEWDQIDTWIGYNVTFTGVAADGEFVPINRMSLVKRNTPKRAKRGVSDFLCLQATFQETMKLLNNSLQGEAARQALLWVQQTTGAVNPVTNVNAQGQQIDGPGCSLGNPGDFNGPKVATVDKNLEFQAIPPGSSSNAAAMLLEGYRALSAYFGTPVWMLAGASDGSVGGTLVEGDTTDPMVKREKKTFTEAIIDLLVKVLKIAEEQGELEEGATDRLDIVPSSPPAAVSRDKPAESQRAKMLHDDGVISARRRSELEEEDFDSEQEQIKAERAAGIVPTAVAEVNQRTANPSTDPAAIAQRTNPHPLSKGGIRDAFDEGKHPRGKDGEFGKGGVPASAKGSMHDVVPGKKKVLGGAKPSVPSVPSVPSGPGPDTSFQEKFHAAFDRLDKERGGHNYVHINHLRKAIDGASREHFDKQLDHLQRSGHYSIQGAEGRGGLSQDDIEGGIRVPALVGSGSDLFIGVSRLKRT